MAFDREWDHHGIYLMVMGFSGASFLNAHKGYHVPELAIYNRPKNHGVLKGFSRFKHQTWSVKPWMAKLSFQWGASWSNGAGSIFPFFSFFSQQKEGGAVNGATNRVPQAYDSWFNGI